jgi:sulfite exporter TauE/SafE
MPSVLADSLVLAALLMGLAGSAHCIGMCGGFAVLAGANQSRPFLAHALVVLWLLGKTLTYAVLGGLLGFVGEAVPVGLVGFQTVVVLFTAVFLVLTGLHLAGVGPSWTLVAPAPVSTFVSRMSAAVQSSSLGGRFVLGLLNGLLPCGLVYAALAYSLTFRSSFDGALFMALFGLGTVPALAVVGLGAGMITVNARRAITRTLGWLIVLLGILTLTRLPAFMDATHGGHGAVGF